MQETSVASNFSHVTTIRCWRHTLRDTTMRYMSTSRAPAKPWYDLVMQELALRGWTMAELVDRSGIAKSTIANWERNPRKPQAAKVNAVADVLDVPRFRALRLAGIIDDGDADRSPAVPPELEAHPDLVESVRRTPGLTDDDRLRVMEAIARTLRGESQPPTPGAEAPSPGARREAGLVPLWWRRKLPRLRAREPRGHGRAGRRPATLRSPRPRFPRSRTQQQIASSQVSPTQSDHLRAM